MCTYSSNRCASGSSGRDRELNRAQSHELKLTRLSYMHAFNQRILAEDLVRIRRPDDRERYAAAQRQARIDPNPHQIDAVIFALRRLREGGCILADEVGLGKTIEAGLVIAQRRAGGARGSPLFGPHALIGQWEGGGF